MSWMDVPTPTNEQSWLRMIQFAQSRPDPGFSEWKAQLVPLLQQGIECGLHHHFLAGQSMHHILFSLIVRYGLEDEPRVTIASNEKMELFAALTNHNIWFTEPAEKVSLAGPDAFRVFKGMLARLWLAARPGEPPPPELQNV